MKNLFFNHDNEVLFPHQHYHELPFIIDNRFIHTTIDKAAVIPVMPECSKYSWSDKVSEIQGITNFKEKLFAIMFNTHIADSANVAYFNDLKNKLNPIIDNIVFVHMNNKLENDSILMYYDFIHHLFYNHYFEFNDYDSKNRAWTGIASSKMFELPVIENKTIEKIFIIPNRIHEDESFRTIFRKKLAEIYYITPQLQKLSYFGNPNINLFLDNQEELNNDFFSGLWPLHNKYYNTSIINAYVESIIGFDEDSSIIGCITEKTLEPLMKGNFILPFSYSGIISDLKKYGFLLPDFIDYSYDHILDKKSRWNSYSFELLRLLNIPVSVYNELYNKNLHILLHNRNLIQKENKDLLLDLLISKLDSNKNVRP